MAPQSQSAKPSEQLHILYLEDDPTDAGFVQVTLEQEGFSCNIELVDNRQDFVDALEEGGYDIIFADFVLPSIDGLTALSIAQEKSPDTPFIIISAYIGEDNAIECLKCGATDCVSKLRLSKLVPAIRRAQKEIDERKKRKEAEQALLKNEQRYRTLFDLSPSGILLEDIDGNIIDVNGAFCNSFGYSQQELVGKNVRLFVPPESVDDVTKHISLILSRGTLEHEVTNVRKDGTLCHMELREKKVMLPDGQDGILVVANDVTLRKRAEEALQTQAQVLNNMIEGVNVSDENAIIFFTNPAFDAMFGYERGQLIGKHVSILNAGEPEEKARVVEEVRGQLETVGFWCGEFNNIQKDGTLFTTQARISTLEVSGKTCLVSVQEDITERKKAEESLQESEEKFRNVAEQSPNMIFINRRGRVVYANKMCEEVMGYTTQEFYSNEFNFLRLIADESLELIKTSFQKHMSGEEVTPYEYALKTKDGRRIESIITTKLIKYGGEAAILGIVTDITERKRAEQSMRKLLRAVEQTDEVIFMTDTDGTITYINPAFQKVYGFSTDEVAGKTPRILKSGMVPMEHYVRFWETILSGESVRNEYLNKTKDGRLVTVQGSVSPIYSGEGTLTGFIAVQKDITDREKAEADRKNLEAQLIQAQKIESLGTLAGGIAHDFNNILGIILGHSTLLEQSADDSAQQSRSTQSIKKAVQRGSNLVGQILTFARKTDVSFESVSVNEIITELARMLEDTFPKTIDILLELEKQIPYIEADRSQLHQTVLNLCVNARDAMPEGGTLSINTGKVGIVELRRTLPEAVEDLFVRVSVSDTGTGMDEATMERLFEPFFTTKIQGKGTGLGLAVVFGIMKSHHGYVDVKSEIGRGSSFHLYFPVAPQSIKMSQSNIEQVHEVAGGSETLLLVEDEEMLRELVQNILQANGYKVLTASDGEEAIHLYGQHKHVIAAVISDVGLPKQSGGEVLSRLKEINPNVNVILASGFIEPEEKHRLQSLGATRFIQKPYVPQQILKHVRELLDHA